MAALMWVACSGKVMGRFRVTGTLAMFGWGATLVMAAAVAAMLFEWV